jgi:hypothetical protein
MTMIRPERLPDLDGDRPAKAEIESEVRNFVRRDFPGWRQRQPDTGLNDGVENIHSLIHRVAGVSVGEIERVIAELQIMRDMLREASDRAQRELTSFADLSHTAMGSLKAVAESLARWRAAGTDAPQEQTADEAR